MGVDEFACLGGEAGVAARFESCVGRVGDVGSGVPEVPGGLRATGVERFVELRSDELGDLCCAFGDLPGGDVVDGVVVEEFLECDEVDSGLEDPLGVLGNADQHRKGRVDGRPGVEGAEVVDDEAVGGVLDHLGAVDLLAFVADRCDEVAQHSGLLAVLAGHYGGGKDGAEVLADVVDDVRGLDPGGDFADPGVDVDVGALPDAVFVAVGAVNHEAVLDELVQLVLQGCEAVRVVGVEWVVERELDHAGRCAQETVGVDEVQDADDLEDFLVFIG